MQQQKRKVIIFVVFVLSLVFLYKYFFKDKLLEGQTNAQYMARLGLASSVAGFQDPKYLKPGMSLDIIDGTITCQEIEKKLKKKHWATLNRAWHMDGATSPHTHFAHNNFKCGNDKFAASITPLVIGTCSYGGYGGIDPQTGQNYKNPSPLWRCMVKKPDDAPIAAAPNTAQYQER